MTFYLWFRNDAYEVNWSVAGMSIVRYRDGRDSRGEQVDMSDVPVELLYEIEHKLQQLQWKGTDDE